jgi:hypothetical protein
MLHIIRKIAPLASLFSTGMTPSIGLTLQSQEQEFDLSQQTLHDAHPFRIQWFSANWFPRPSIPIACVVLPQLELEKTFLR